jgi:hypothetical protein
MNSVKPVAIVRRKYVQLFAIVRNGHTNNSPFSVRKRIGWSDFILIKAMNLNAPSLGQDTSRPAN